VNTLLALRTPGNRTGSAHAVTMDGVSKRFPVRRSWARTFLHPMRREWSPAVVDLSLEIPEGEFFGLLGANGAGKTTIFRMLASTVLPDHGAIRVGGIDIVRHSRAARGILACVPPEERSLLWRLSAAENLYLYGSMFGMRGPGLRRRAAELLEIVELQDAGGKMVGKFSSGMKQRLMIARALLGEPRILLLDEPTRGLDPLGARRLREFIRTELVAGQGCTVLLATHNGEEALEYCDRVAVLDRGRLLAVGPASTLSRQVRGERYEAWTREPDHPAWSGIGALGAVEVESVAPAGEEGWWRVELTFRGGSDDAAGILGRLALAGVTISRFAPLPLVLADLLEQVVARGGDSVDE